MSTVDEVRYDAPTGSYAYGEFELLTIDYNVRGEGTAHGPAPSNSTPATTND